METNRRDFLISSTAAIAAGTFVSSCSVADEPQRARSNKDLIYSAYKGGKIGNNKEEMIATLTAAKKLGFDGIEGQAIPDVPALKEAIKETDFPVSGLVDAIHWKIRLSDPDPKVREQGKVGLEAAIRDAYELRSSSVLLVPGKVGGKDETHDDVWKRSIIEIRKVIPLASRLGIQILIENVWNGFCETPEELRDYIDEIDNPWVGVHFDIGNVRKFSPPEDWIRMLGKRVVKLDVKDWGKKNGFCRLGEGDVDWPEVRKALKETRFSGWATREGQSRDNGLEDTIALVDKYLDL